VIIKIVVLFLIGIGVLAMFGRLRLPKPMRRRPLAKQRTCTSCGGFIIGAGPCACGASPPGKPKP